MVKFCIRLLAVLCILKMVESKSTRHKDSPEDSAGAESRSNEHEHKRIQKCHCGSNSDNPVCGSDDGIYRNACHFNCALARNRKLKRVPCKNDNDKEDESKEKSASNSESGSNEKISSKRSCSCGKHLDPVCGSNDRTYGSRCLLKCAKKRVPGLKVKSEGHCPIDRKSRGHKKTSRYGHIKESKSCFCSRSNRPVCGSDGETYRNKCLLKCEKKNNRNLEIVKNNACSNDEGSSEGRGFKEDRVAPAGPKFPHGRGFSTTTAWPRGHGFTSTTAWPRGHGFTSTTTWPRGRGFTTTPGGFTTTPPPFRGRGFTTSTEPGFSKG